MILWAIIALAVAALLTAYGAVIQAVRYNAAVISRFPRRTVSYNFDGLTHDQATLLTFGGWTPESRPRRRPAAAVVRKLIARGLLTVRRVHDGGLQVEIYEVPPAVHAAWLTQRARTY